MVSKRLAVIDDDEAVRQALIWLLEGQGYDVTGFDSAEAFLVSPQPLSFNSIILDLRLSGMSGIVLLEQLSTWPYCPPVTMLTAHGDVPHAVAALRLGAVDFMEKPFDDDKLLARVESCLLQDAESRHWYERRTKVEAALGSLTEREKEVMHLILVGKLNKQIAEELSISMKTVEVHRARVFEKMGVKSAVELAGVLTVMDGGRGG